VSKINKNNNINRNNSFFSFRSYASATFFFLVSIACDVLFASTKVLIIKYVFHFCLLCDLMIYNVLNERIFVVNIALQSAKL